MGWKAPYVTASPPCPPPSILPLFCCFTWTVKSYRGQIAIPEMELKLYRIFCYIPVDFFFSPPILQWLHFFENWFLSDTRYEPRANFYSVIWTPGKYLTWTSIIINLKELIKQSLPWKLTWKLSFSPSLIYGSKLNRVVNAKCCAFRLPNLLKVFAQSRRKVICLMAAFNAQVCLPFSFRGCNIFTINLKLLLICFFFWQLY